jgi:hypothetical protein
MSKITLQQAELQQLLESVQKPIVGVQKYALPTSSSDALQSMISCNTVVKLPKGTHTIQPQWKCAGGNITSPYRARVLHMRVIK